MIYPNDPAVNIIQVRPFWYPLISYPVLAAYTPDEHEIEIIDEVFEAVDYDEPVDLVALTAMTYMAPRAYEIADAFRQRGVPVVMGGIHVSSLSLEANRHADAVVIGEAELTWQQVLEDVKNNTLKPYYKADAPLDMTQYRRPWYELLEKYFQPGKQYHPYGYNSLNVMEISRGCPFDCDFCAVTDYFGADYRSRPVEAVSEDMRYLKLRFKDRFMNFNDDNLYGNRPHFIRLLKGMLKLNIQWAGQISLNVGRDDEAMKLIAESGCQTLFVGLESLSDESLQSINKKVNRVHDYHFFVEQCIKYKIRVAVSIIFGLDGDDENSFKTTVEFVSRYPDVLTPSYTILTPFPGSRLYERLNTENRIIDRDWRHYDLGHVVIQPKRMSPQTLKDGLLWAMEQFEPYRMNKDQVGRLRMKTSTSKMNNY